MVRIIGDRSGNEKINRRPNDLSYQNTQVNYIDDTISLKNYIDTNFVLVSSNSIYSTLDYIVNLDEKELGFKILKHEVSFINYTEFCDSSNKDYPNNHGWAKFNHPVFNVSWYGAIEYCNWLSSKYNLKPKYKIFEDGIQVEEVSKRFGSLISVEIDSSSKGFRLPTVEEWNYSASVGGYYEVWSGTDMKKNLKYYANYFNSGNENDGYKVTSPVGSFEPNQLGIYDLCGNVAEWCWPNSEIKFVSTYGVQKDRILPSSAKVPIKGGSWKSNAKACNYNLIHLAPPNLKSSIVGFRVIKAD